MLAKQGWRIIKQPSLLLNRIFRARYSPMGDFLSSERVSNMSYTWRSILDARGVIKAGLRWKTGDGQQVALNTLLDASRNGVEHSGRGKQSWSFIWKARVPHKVKVFMWRLYKEALPTTMNLCRRRCNVDLPSLTCGNPLEDTVIFGWLEGTEVWVRQVRKGLENDQFNLFIMICWSLWGRRNRFVMENDNCKPDECVTLADISNPEHGKALAARLALELCLQFGSTSCIVEGDYLQVIQNIRSLELDSSSISPTIHDIRSLIPVVGSFSLCFVRRSANMAAHHLSRLDISDQGGSVPPITLLETLRADAHPE
ncbi:UNVERIFIED_CONTAM: hypothetical protein Sradi_1624900 [Sesamum radiatum]|uniref:Reverse transcriptase zinc-binding domain-containing protein n=1 Tax=Sesamum radiatum TaxID=300843 RepID=A0AAW2UC53_SESRA